MKSIAEVQKRARAKSDRSWRDCAARLYANEPCAPELAVSLQPPREKDLATAADVAKAREWVTNWRDCKLPGIEWQTRSWARVGNQTIPVSVRMQSIDEIARWADRSEQWGKALDRMADVSERLAKVNPRPNTDAVANAVKSSLGNWCSLSDDDWNMALLVWDWLFAHDDHFRFVRQLPIRGIDTKWIERHGKTLRDLHIAVTGGDFSFRQPSKLFRCKACDPAMTLAGCSEFALSARQLDKASMRPDRIVICENLVNTLCLDDQAGTLALHGSGFAVAELQAVSWLARVPILYWGDLDSNGFAILNTLRSFAPHTESIMMDEKTLHRYFDLCVNEPKPATGSFPNLTNEELATLEELSRGDPSRNIDNLRLEQERIEWSWAVEQISSWRGR